MHKCYLLTILVLLVLNNKSITQKNPAENKSATDSMNSIIDSLSLADLMDKPSRYIQVGFGMSKKFFSVEANSKIMYTPTVGGFHKSGFIYLHQLAYYKRKRRLLILSNSYSC